ncbi:MAG: hypothetical protein ACRDQ1_13475 [Sciscionella sp.]
MLISRSVSHLRRRSMMAMAVLAASATLLAGCGANGSDNAAGGSNAKASHSAASHNGSPSQSSMPAGSRTPSEAALYAAMEHLWSQHMEWTYSTIAAFKGNQEALTPTLTRLLANQTDLGDAIKPYYGDAASNKLSKLLHAHINGYVPVLKAAAAGDSAGVKKAFDKVLANGVQIAKFLAKANPNWPESPMADVMNTHNQQTLKYAAAQLQGDYAKSIKLYGQAEQHMWKMGDMMAAGIIKQFPDKFTS